MRSLVTARIVAAAAALGAAWMLWSGMHALSVSGGGPPAGQGQTPGVPTTSVSTSTSVVTTTVTATSTSTGSAPAPPVPDDDRRLEAKLDLELKLEWSVSLTLFAGLGALALAAYRAWLRLLVGAALLVTLVLLLTLGRAAASGGPISIDHHAAGGDAMTFLWALLAGAGAVVVYLLLCIVVSGLRPLRLVEGADGRLSTSKLQTWAWTVAVAFAYVAVYTARAVHGDHSALATVPRNVLIALGFSVGTMVAAKGITSAYVNSKLPLTKPPAAQSSVADLVADDSGVPDLSKTQFLVFTLIAIGIFIVNVLDQVNNITLNGPTPDNSTLPDIDSVLMVLMGLSSGTYLGKKLVTTGTTPTLLPSSVNVAGGTQTVSLYGVGFGTPPQGSAVVGGYVKPNGCGVMLDGYPAALAADWSDTQLTFRVDPAQPPISNWPAGPPPADRQTSGTVKVSVLSFGQPVGGPLDLTVTR